MFGTGFFTFKTKIAENDAKKFIMFCVDIKNLEDEDIIFEKTEELLKNDIKGMGVASVSQILHCLKPFIFPILNGGEGAGWKVYKKLEVDLVKPRELPFYIQNVKNIREFRDKNFNFKNYRIFDLALSESGFDINNDSNISSAKVVKEVAENEGYPIAETIAPYTKQDLLNEVFIGEDKYDLIMYDLAYKKNIILQGSPGVGKTFVARRLAHARMGLKDNSKIQMIQFHQSYSYEDFIQGFRPTEDGRFKLKNGVFYQFCKKAQSDQEHAYYFIIDEINRGNLSKIFGELMMLIEADKRGKDFEIPLTYARDDEDKFYIPENLYLIGTMNTADRSLAMVDYALRRRFCFIDIEPAFSTEVFTGFMEEKGIGTQLINRIITGMDKLNEKISIDNKNLGKGYRIGHSYFCNTPKQGESQEAWYERIILSEIRPILYEYWFDDEETADLEVKKLL